MEKIGIFYSFNSNKTAKVAQKIMERFSPTEIEAINAELVTGETFGNFNNLILGVPTWFDGELPNYWDEFVPELQEMDLTGKKVAIYGLGDQKGYPENFNDGIGIMADLLASKGAEIVGYTSANGYVFESSRAVRGDIFCGLCLDQENQARLTSKRIDDWTEQIKKEFN
jgi:flavodoxin I